MCTAGQFNLSHSSLTSFDAREKLRNLRITDPVFWTELTAGQAPVIAEDAEVDEDHEPVEPEDEDDSDLSCDVVVASAVSGKVPAGACCKVTGKLASAAAAESLEYMSEERPGWASKEEGLGTVQGSSRGAGKRQVRANKHYTGDKFWHH